MRFKNQIFAIHWLTKEVYDFKFEGSRIY